MPGAPCAPGMSLQNAVPNPLLPHPVIRLASLLVLAVGCSFVDITRLFMIAGLLALLLFLSRAGHASYPPSQHALLNMSLWSMIRRMRWLLAALLIVYFWFTPGAPILPGPVSFTAYLPTQEGVEGGLLRIASLLLLLTAVFLLFKTSSREQLIAALHGLVSPLARFGFRGANRLALRIVLTLEAVVQVQGLFDEVADTRTTVKPWARISQGAAFLFERVVVEAERMPQQVISVAEGSRPPIYQWGYPLVLGLSLWL